MFFVKVLDEDKRYTILLAIVIYNKRIFFFLDNVKILLKKVPNQVHWGCTMGAQIKNQNYNDQVKQEGKNKKNKKRPHSSQRECARKKT